MRSSYTMKSSTHRSCNIANDAANKGLNSKVYKQLIQLSIKKKEKKKKQPSENNGQKT